MFKAMRADGGWVLVVFDAGTNWAALEEMRWLGNNGRGSTSPAPNRVPNRRVQRDPAELGATACFFGARAPLPKQQQLRVQLLPGS